MRLGCSIANQRGEATAHRLAGQRQLVQPEPVEEVEVVQQVVVEAVDARIVGGSAEPGVVGDDQPEPLGQGKQVIEAESRARTVEVDNRVAVTRGEHRGVDPVDVDVVFLELRHHFTPAVASSRSPVFAPASRARILGITSSANSVVLFATFHSGMSPFSSTTFTRPAPAS